MSAFLPDPFVRSLFLAPRVLLFAALAAAVALVALVWLSRRAARTRDALIAPSIAERAGLAPPAGTGPVTFALVALVVLGVGAALARPRWGRTMEAAERRGTDVVFVMDTSASMRATDVSPSRFTLARQAAQSLLDKLGSDRVALVACEGEAQTLVPLTLDTAAAGLFLDALEPGIGAKPGTSLAAGLKSAAELYPGGAVGGKHCVVFSDGEDLEGGVDEAIEKAKAEGMVVHTVFVGVPSGRGAPVPEVDVSGRLTGYKIDASGTAVLSKPDPDLLRKLAARTHGTFSTVSTGRTDLSGVAKEIDLSARRPMSEVLLTNLEERFQVPLAVGVCSLGLLLLGVGRRASTYSAAKRKNVFLLRRGRKEKTAVVAAALSLLVTARAGAQQQPAPAASATPAPLPFLRKVFSSPRSEARKGVKAMDEKKLDEAIGHFGREIEISPKDLTGSYNLGTAQSSAGNANDALASLEKARKEGRPDLAADAAYNAGETLFRAKEYETAASAFREALRLKPGDPEASWNYELCVRRAEEEKKKKDQQKKKDQDQKQQPQKPSPTPGPSPTPQSRKQDEQKKKQEEDKQFESKANMSRDKAEQLLAAIQQADLDEQKKKIAEQKRQRRVGRDW
jgi:Ca-activated chloride channel family protein